MENGKLLCTVGGIANWYTHYVKQYGDSSKNEEYNYHIHLWVFIQRIKKLVLEDMCTSMFITALFIIFNS